MSSNNRRQGKPNASSSSLSSSSTIKRAKQPLFLVRHVANPFFGQAPPSKPQSQSVPELADFKFQTEHIQKELDSWVSISNLSLLFPFSRLFILMCVFVIAKAMEMELQRKLHNSSVPALVMPQLRLYVHACSVIYGIAK